MNTGLEKIVFPLDPSDWHGRPNESLWAEAVGDVSPTRVFRLKNSPFFARGVSFLDTVRAAPRIDGAGLEFAQVLDRSGHSTYMLLVPPICSHFDIYWSKLEKLGCTYESRNIETSLGERKLYSVDVPPTSDIYRVYGILEDGERRSIWTFQEGHVGHQLRSDR
jgi:hypothetical protein